MGKKLKPKTKPTGIYDFYLVGFEKKNKIE